MPLAAPVIKTVSLLRSFLCEVGMKSFTKATSESHKTRNVNTSVSLSSSILDVWWRGVNLVKSRLIQLLER